MISSPSGITPRRLGARFSPATARLPRCGATELRLSSTDSLIVTLCVGLSNFIWLPVMGALSDRIGRRPILITFTILALLTAYPAMLWLTSAPIEMSTLV
jgi:MFS transporter, MHS family, citrate/tricarballylate:H+ symporter